MSGFIKKLFGTLMQKPWEKEQMAIDSLDEGRAFNISSQKSAVIIIFGIATVLFSLVFTAYLYTIPPEQDTMYLLKPNLLWINTIILFFVTYFFGKITKDLEKKNILKIKLNKTVATPKIIITADFCAEILKVFPSCNESIAACSFSQGF